jgi:hypothetical protein
MNKTPIADMLRGRFSAGVILLSFFVAGFSACSPKPTLPSAFDPCRLMREQIHEKQKLDAKVKSVSKRAEDFRKTGDTASAASAENRLKGLLENQRLLKESLEQSGRDCHPSWQDPPPVRDPARREHHETR